MGLILGWFVWRGVGLVGVKVGLVGVGIGLPGVRVGLVGAVVGVVGAGVGLVGVGVGWSVSSVYKKKKDDRRLTPAVGGGWG